MSLLTEDNLDRAARRIMAITEDFYPELVPKPYHPAAVAFHKLVAGKFGCYEKSVLDLVGAITGHEMPPARVTTGQHGMRCFTALYCEKDEEPALMLPGAQMVDSWSGKAVKFADSWHFDVGHTRLCTLDEAKAVLWANRDNDQLTNKRAAYLLGIDYDDIPMPVRDFYAEMAKRVRQMRKIVREHRENTGWPSESPGRHLLDGEIKALTDVLALLCQDPWND